MKKITIATELQKEFGLLFRALSEKSARFIAARPGLVFSAMLLLMCASGIYVFLFLKDAASPAANRPADLAASMPSVESVSETYAKLKLTLSLQSSVKVLLSKDSLTHSDSLQLAALLKEIQKIQNDKIPQ